MNLRPSGYEPDELPGCSTPRVLLPLTRYVCRAVWRELPALAGLCGAAAATGRLCLEKSFRVTRAFSAVLGRPGGDRLSRVLRRSTMGAEGFDGRVRNGIGFGPLAWATRPAKHSAGRSPAGGLGDRVWGWARPCRSFQSPIPKTHSPLSTGLSCAALLERALVNESDGVRTSY